MTALLAIPFGRCLTHSKWPILTQSGIGVAATISLTCFTSWRMSMVFWCGMSLSLRAPLTAMTPHSLITFAPKSLTTCNVCNITRVCYCGAAPMKMRRWYLKIGMPPHATTQHTMGCTPTCTTIQCWMSCPSTTHRFLVLRAPHPMVGKQHRIRSLMTHRTHATGMCITTTTAQTAGMCRTTQGQGLHRSTGSNRSHR
eukprot:PhF_6_TR42646/c0_g1_i1/m.64182